MNLKETLLASIPPESTVYVAYSGGVDSSVLLAILAGLKHCDLTAIHINHGLSPNADKWQEHCHDFCQKYSVKFLSAQVSVASSGSVEANARKERYHVFESLLKPKDILLTAQHQDDQAETLMLRLLRGSGPVGLSAMSKERSLGEGVLLRPWLGVAKAEILAYAQENTIAWVEDESNLDTRFDRNFLRKEVMPLLRSRWPSTDKTLSRSADLCGVYVQNFDQDAEGHLAIDSFEAKDFNQTCLQIYHWLRQVAEFPPSKVHIENIVNEVVGARADAVPQVTWESGQVRRYQNKLYYLKKPASLEPIVTNYQCQGEKLLALDGLAITLKKHESIGQGFKLEKESKCEIRFYQGGESIKPIGHKKTKKVKKIFQENKVPPWERRVVPLVFVDDILVQLVGICGSADHQVAADEQGCEIILFERNSL